MVTEHTSLNAFGQFIPRKKLLENYSPYQISLFVRDGYITKINNTYYQNNTYDGEESDLTYANAYVPNGVISFMSAAVYYDLSNNRPMAVDVTVQANSYVPSFPDWPPVKLHYMEKKYFNFAVTTYSANGSEFSIFEIEKVVADIVKYRESIGIEETKEVLTNYLKRSDRDLNKLIRYSKANGCEKQMRTYLEVLV